MMDPQRLHVIVDVILALIVGILGFYQWLSRKSQVNTERIERLEADLGSEIRSNAREITRIQTQMEHSPGRDDLKRIHERIDQQTKCVSRMEGELLSVKGTLSMVHEYLLNRDTT